MALTPKQINILRLVRRSTPVDGWYKVSASVWPVIEDARMPDELVETTHGVDGRLVRLTPKGETVMAYLI